MVAADIQELSACRRATPRERSLRTPSDHFGNFNARSIARKRGFLRSGSKNGSVFTYSSPASCKRIAVSSQSSALERSPQSEPAATCTPASRNMTGPQRDRAASRIGRSSFHASVARQLAVFEIAIIRRTVLLPVFHQSQSCREGLKARVPVEGLQPRSPQVDGGSAAIDRARGHAIQA